MFKISISKNVLIDDSQTELIFWDKIFMMNIHEMRGKVYNINKLYVI